MRNYCMIGSKLLRKMNIMKENLRVMKQNKIKICKFFMRSLGENGVVIKDLIKEQLFEVEMYLDF